MLIQAILRHERGINPQTLDQTGGTSDRRLISVLIGLPIIQNMDGAMGGGIAECAVPTPAAVNASGVARWQFIDLLTAGLPPGGDRWVGMLRRNA